MMMLPLLLLWLRRLGLDWHIAWKVLGRQAVVIVVFALEHGRRSEWLARCLGLLAVAQELLGVAVDGSVAAHWQYRWRACGSSRFAQTRRGFDLGIEMRVDVCEFIVCRNSRAAAIGVAQLYEVKVGAEEQEQ